MLACCGQQSLHTCTSTLSKVAYFKRKYAEEEDVQGGLQGYLQKHLILREERSCILRLSLQKLRFLDDPEAYLRRSVLINNLLRKIRLDDKPRDGGEDDRIEGEEEEGAEERGPALFYSARKRLKVMVAECCSPNFEDLRDLDYPAPAHPPPSCPCGRASCPAPPPPILLYRLNPT